MSRLHFPPTALAKKNLASLYRDINQLEITGNTGIDALKYVQRGIETQSIQFDNPQAIQQIKALKLNSDHLILLTLHRREIHGPKMEALFKALSALIKEQSIGLMFPAHKHPLVRKAMKEQLKSNDRVLILEPLEYQDFIYAMLQSDLIISDSGGVQEEAPSLGKRVLVVRNETERPEAIGGINVLAGTEPAQLVTSIKESLKAPSIGVKDVYGDGNACKRIAIKIDQYLSSIS